MPDAVRHRHATLPPAYGGDEGDGQDASYGWRPGSAPNAGNWGRSRRLRFSSANPGAGQPNHVVPQLTA